MSASGAALAAPDVIHSYGGNIVLVAPEGLGKTVIAQNIARAAVLAGHHVLLTTAAQMLLDSAARRPGPAAHPLPHPRPARHRLMVSAQ